MRLTRFPPAESRLLADPARDTIHDERLLPIEP